MAEDDYYTASSDDDYIYTIGDIARMYDIGRDSLRYYEEHGIISPKRGANGYRLYSRKDIWRINVIVNLRSLGLSVGRIARYFESRSLDSTMQLLMEELGSIQSQLNDLLAKQQQVTSDLQVLFKASNLVLDQVTRKTLPLRRAHCIERDYDTDEEMDLLMLELEERAGGGRQLIANNRIASVLSDEDAPHIYQAAILFDNKGDYVLPAGDYLSICYKGPWNSVRQAEVVRKYAQENGLTLVGPFIDIIWIDIHTAAYTDEHVSEVQCRIK